MLKTRTLILYLLIPFFAFTQDAFPDFGKPTAEELRIKTCLFDPEADAVVLKHEAISEFSWSGKIFTQHHFKIKILKESAFDRANILIPFYSKDNIETVEKIRGVVTNNDGGTPEIHFLESGAIYTVKKNDHWSEVRLSMPSVQVGSIIEYYYINTILGVNNIEDWYFQKDIPVLVSKFELNVGKRLEFTYQIISSESNKVKTTKKDRTIIFEMNDIPAFKTEPFMDSPKDYLQRVVFQLSGFSDDMIHTYSVTSSWKLAAKELMSSKGFGVHLDNKITGNERFISSLTSTIDEKERMLKIYKYVQQNVTWNGSKGIYIDENLKTAWERKICSNSEMNLILVNLLSQAGLDADPVLISERQHGKVSSDYPFLQQFNCVYATIRIGNNRYFLNAADETISPLIIPFEILNTTAFIVTRKGGELINITDKVLQYLEYINIETTLTKQGSAEGFLQMSSADYAKADRLKRIKNVSGKDSIENMLPDISGLELADYKIRNREDDSPLIQSFRFSFNPESNDRNIFFSPNPINLFERNPFTADKRNSHINFGYRRSLTINHTIKIPEGYTIDFSPEKKQITNSPKGLSFYRITEIDENNSVITFRFKVEIQRSIYLANEYGELKSFFKNMFDLNSEKLILRKN